jgi:NADPH2:quinone reductase
MRAIVCHELSGPASLRLEELAEAAPRSRQVRIRVRACGVNFADSLITRGQYQKQPQPALQSPALKFPARCWNWALACKRVRRRRSGDRHDAARRLCRAGHRRCAALCADAGGDVLGTRRGLSGGVRHLACRLVASGALAAGETLVVHGASGGVGLTAVAIGKQLGATVIATANGPAKLRGGPRARRRSSD